MKLILPTIHLNGTSAAELIRGHEAVEDKLRELIDAIDSVEFNARDYYPQGPDAWTLAKAQRNASRAKIVEVLAENTSILEHLFQFDAAQ